VAAYHQHVLHERGFSRLKTRNVQIRPVSLREERRIAGLRWLLCLALRVLTLTDHRRRIALAQGNEDLVGLNPASRTQVTQRPTTERVIAACANITLTTIHTAGACHHHVTPLNTTQRQILVLLQLPANLYERLAPPSPNLVRHLRE
jgi:transposase